MRNNTDISASVTAGKSSVTVEKPPVAKRRHWLRWTIVGIFLLLLVAIWMLPYLATLPRFRDRWMGSLSARLGARVDVSDISLGWFSPVVLRDLKIQNNDAGRAVLAVPAVEGDRSLLSLLLTHDLGTFHIKRPELYVEFDDQGSNLGRLLSALSSSAFFSGRRAQWDIVDGRLLVRGRGAKEPWAIEPFNLTVDAVPAAQSKSGVPVLQGGAAHLLNHAELTPEICNDLLKFITPALAYATTTKGRVSLDLDEFMWPVGKPELAALKGKLTLHEVESGAGATVQTLVKALKLPEINGNVQVTKDDVVTFSMQDGRIHHENLIFSLSALRAEPIVRSHGSVGLDETLDWFLDMPGFANLVAEDNPIRNALGKIQVHFVGTLSNPQLAAKDSPALKLFESVRERLQERRGTSAPKGEVDPGKK
jgi:hypothetical protein